MKRLLSSDDLASLILLVEEKMPDSNLLQYLKTVRHNKWGDGALYAVNLKGAICLQLHLSEF
jgi:hypothetical protein